MLEVCIGETRWPKDFMDISNRTFSWVYENRKEFVEFTLEKMDNASGMFLQWQNYCQQQIKDADRKGQAGKSPPVCK